MLSKWTLSGKIWLDPSRFWDLVFFASNFNSLYSHQNAIQAENSVAAKGPETSKKTAQIP